MLVGIVALEEKTCGIIEFMFLINFGGTSDMKFQSRSLDLL